MKYIKKFSDIRLSDTPLVGGKNSSIGQMIKDLSDADIRIPDGFAVTAEAYRYFLSYNNLVDSITQEVNKLQDIQDIVNLRRVGHSVRSLIENGVMPDDLVQEITQAYQELSDVYGVDAVDVAVRSSATAEDLAEASFAGQQETFLNISGTDALVDRCRSCMASLFTDRAIVYRVAHGFDHMQVALSVGVQKMVRSDTASAGVAFSLDTETGFKDVVMINGAWGLGETIVKGSVIPDEFFVHKQTMRAGFQSIIKKQCGQKKIKMIYSGRVDDPVQIISVDPIDQKRVCLTDQEIFELARMVDAIDQYYSQLKGFWSPMDIEWAKDGGDGQLYIVQARSETVHSQKQHEQSIIRFSLTNPGEKKIIVSGQSIGQQIVSGVARVICDVADIDLVKSGDILVTGMTDPDWVPVMKRAAAIITDRGGRTCHAAIVSRELGVPALVGTGNATELISDGASITLDCSGSTIGHVYEGNIPFVSQTVYVKDIPEVPVEVLVNCADPDRAFSLAKLPVAGVGLARLEFIITQAIKVHPMALVHPERILDEEIREKINQITASHDGPIDFFVDTLARGVGMIAAAMYPKKVIVRLSDFKTNEYRNLIGGSDFEPEEENPMLGFRGAARYTHDRYKEAFALECLALKKVRDDMGFSNVAIMVPFVRTVAEGQQIIEVLDAHGLSRGRNDLELVMMVEVPSNVLLIDQFSQYFDGFSIGSNDLAQLTLGVDRDSEILSGLFDERDSAVKKMMQMAIVGAHTKGKFIGICGQAPSDYPEIAEFLLEQGVDSLSLNTDSVIPFLMRYQK